MVEVSIKCLSPCHERTSLRKRDKPKRYKMEMVKEVESPVVIGLLAALVFVTCFPVIMFALYPQSFNDSGVVKVIMENSMMTAVGLGVCLVGASCFVQSLSKGFPMKDAVEKVKISATCFSKTDSMAKGRCDLCHHKNDSHGLTL